MCAKIRSDRTRCSNVSRWTTIGGRTKARYNHAMDSTERPIPVRDRQQALEWSLVLASQDIHATILPADDDAGWRLMVPERTFRHAVTSLRHYLTENKQTRWHQALPGAGMMLDTRAAVWCLLWIVLFAMEQSPWPQLRTAGIMDSHAVGQGEWWRLFTAVQLHADLGHLAANVTTGFLLLGLAMGAYGFGWAMLATFLSGAAGNLAGWFLYDSSHRSLGASGMVLGALGLLTVQSLTFRKTNVPTRERLWVRGLFGGLLLLVLMGFSPQSDIIAHVGGFVGGCVAGTMLQLLPVGWATRPRSNWLAEFLAVLLMLLCWWLALRTS